jgi:transposase-like protein
MKDKKEIISDHQIRELAREFTRSGKLTGEGGLFTPLLKRVIEASLEAEVEDHVEKTRRQGNRRNGYGSKQLKTSLGAVDVDTPRDRDASFSPLSLPKRSNQVSNEFEEKVLALYARGMSYRDIQSQLRELYGTEVSTGLLAAITDKIWPEVEMWRKRPLEALYPVVWLDAMFFKVRGDDAKVITKAVYSILGVNTSGQKEILGFYLAEHESTSFWRKVLAELKDRGVKDILIACIDGLKGFPEAIEDEFPQTQVQLCIVHQIRNSIKYLSYKDVKPFLKDLKTVYTADNIEHAQINLEHISQKWGTKYQRPLKGWHTHFEPLMGFLKYPQPLRRIIYTTNPIESFHRQVRKITKTKGAYTSEKAVFKQVYLVCQSANHKWSGTMYNWNPVRLALAEFFDHRFTNLDTLM